MQSLNDIKALLKDNNLRITQSRLAVATVLLRNTSKHLAAEEIYHKISSSKKLNCDQVSVYRILSTFESMGLIQKSIFQGEATRYSLISPQAGAECHRHFFKCSSCKMIEPFEGCLVVKKERELEKKGYINLRHHLEITGVCPMCAGN